MLGIHSQSFLYCDFEKAGDLAGWRRSDLPPEAADIISSFSVKFKQKTLDHYYAIDTNFCKYPKITPAIKGV
jgi:hypothetical protein